MSTHAILFIKGECIINDKMFREHFDLYESLSLIRVVIEAGHSLFTDEDLNYLGYLEDSINGILPKDIHTGERGWKALFEGDKELSLPYLIVNDENVNMLTLKDWQKILLSHLAHQLYTLNVTETKDEIQVSDIIEVTDSAVPLRLQLFSLSQKLPCLIRTVKIVNHSFDEGHLVICVVNDKGETIDMMTLRYGECRFANFLGDRLIEFLPIMSLSRTQMGCFRFGDDGIISIQNKRVNSQSESSFCIDGVTQFCVDEQDGVIAISNGKLVVRSVAFSVRDTRFKMEPSEQIVKIAIMGRIFLALSSLGKVYSNIAKFRNLEKRNIISIGINWDGVPYYLLSDGRFITSFEQCDNVYSAISTNIETFSLKLRSGSVRYSNKEFLPAIPEETVCINGKEYRLDLKTRTLYLDDLTSELADNVDSFGLLKTSDGYNLVTCSGSELQVIKTNIN